MNGVNNLSYGDGHAANVDISGNVDAEMRVFRPSLSA